MWGKILTIVIILAALVVGGFVYKNYFQPGRALSSQEVGEKAVAYINEKMLEEGVSATLMNAKEESGIYKIHFKIQEREHDAYVSKDGKLLFPQAIDLEEVTQTPAPQAEEKSSCKDFTKTDQPLLEAFVVSKCPFGIQMQRILEEIVKNIPSL